MPIAFQTKNHGAIPFGFFNIETDLLLADTYFVFCSDFCRWLVEWAGNTAHAREMGIYTIENKDQVGDLMGAIHGYRFTGFIGALYKIFPFPEDPEGFRQKPYGARNRRVVEELIGTYARRTSIHFSAAETEDAVVLGRYIFSGPVFLDAIQYVWEGGMPRWEEDTPPDGVTKMMQNLRKSRRWPFNTAFG